MESAKGLSNVNIKGRVKQILVLLAVILAGIAISHSTHAQSYHRSNAKHFRNKYKIQIKNNDKVCTILAKKRTQEPKKPLFSFLKSKPKYKPQAEVDAPSYVRISSKPILTAQISERKTRDSRE